MKLLRLFGGNDYPITDKQDKIIDQAIQAGIKFVKLKGIGKINISSISVILDEAPKIPVYEGYIVNTQDWSFYMDGKKFYISREEELEKIKYVQNPNYEVLNENQIDSPKNIIKR